MNVRRCLALLGLVPAAAACASPGIEVTHVLTGPPLAARPDQERVAVYFNEAPARPYREIAQIRVRAAGESANARDVIAAAADDARELGADAIIVDMRRHYHSVTVQLRCEEASVDPQWRLNARVTAIRFVGEGAADPEPPPSGPPPERAGCP